MHLLQAQSGVIEDGGEAIDLGQAPGDIIIISAADTELASLSGCATALDGFDLSLRLANFMSLGHNLSIDTYLESTVRHAKLVILRLLGGASYWAYGLEQLAAMCRAHNIALAVLPGDVKPDPGLLGHSTLDAHSCQTLHAYLNEGGPENARNFLRFCVHLLGNSEAPPEPTPFLKAGLYWPGIEHPALDNLRARWAKKAPVSAIVFYRALLQGNSLAPVDALIDALTTEGLNPLPIFISSLKEDVSVATIKQLFAQDKPDIIVNCTGFAVSTPGQDRAANPLAISPLESPGCPVLQVIFSGSGEAAWTSSPHGLGSRDLAMNVALPEVDGRILARAVSFKTDSGFDEATQARVVIYKPVPDRIEFTAKLARAWTALGKAKPETRKIAIVLANYPNRDGRIGNGVGLDTPASTIHLMESLQNAGYDLADIPGDGDGLIKLLQQGQTNRITARDDLTNRPSDAVLSLENYETFFTSLPEKIRREITARWGKPDTDPFVRNGVFQLPVKSFGNIVVGIQPARGYNIDPKSTYHDPDLVPPHGYLAFYAWLRNSFEAHAVIHNGKHGNLEWLPGKAVGLSRECYPEAVLGPTPHIYPFIVNDPGEGTQAKRRSAAVIIDHLTPPLTRAESYGPLKDLEALVDEYYQAAGLDPRRLEFLRNQIFDLSKSSGMDVDCGLIAGEDDDTALQKLDNYLCELKEMQIRNGLHILGKSPEGELETDLLVALARVPRAMGENEDASLIRALANDLGFAHFDPLDCVLGEAWSGERPDILQLALPHDLWRTNGDTVERLELLAADLVAGRQKADDSWRAAGTVMREIETAIRPSLRASGANELAGMKTALDGRFVEPGPSGAPTRGRLDVLPTGRNFYSVDNRMVPTPAAWTLGRKSAELLVQHFVQTQGNWPRQMGLSVWGTSNMRTGGDDIAQALALIGARPKWDKISWRLTGFEIVTLAELGRPRVDVTMRVSGFFRDAFPTQMDLFDSAVKAIAKLDEDAEDNPIADRMRSDRQELMASGMSSNDAEQIAGYRIFGSKPGAYGAGLQALMDEKIWDNRGDLADAYLTWGGYAYGGGSDGQAAHQTFANRLGAIQAIVQNQDNREHDLLDSDDYYQFEGGMAAAVEHLSGDKPAIYHNDHSRPERPVIRTLEEEIGRVVRARVVNPKWIDGVMRHGYKGAFEIAATIDYMFAFAATTGAVRDHHFELAYEAFIEDDKVRDFLQDVNPEALKEIAARLLEAMERDLWATRSNTIRYELEKIHGDKPMAGVN